MGVSASDAYGPDFQMLKSAIESLTGFICRYYRDSYLDRRIKVRMRARNIDTYMEYLRLLKRDKEEQKKLYSALTINVTQFFRNAEAWEAVKKKVFQPLLRQGYGTEKQLSIWSAGTSDGREAYTIAMILSDMLGSRTRSARVSILGTDIDDDMLDVARNGIYYDMPLNKVKDQIPPAYLERYVDVSGKEYRIKPEVKRLCQFRHHDLISGEKFRKRFDIIFCRNVVIYFTKDLQNVLFVDLINALRDNGYLILGKTETLFGPARNVFEVIDTRERIYRLPERS